MRDPMFTLTAGPTQTWPSVQAAMSGPIVYDYDPVFLERFARTERKVAELFRTSGDVVLMQGEAVLGLEAAARALVRPGMTAINLVSGVYAKWFGLWLAEYGANLVEVEVPYDEHVDPALVRQALADHPDAGLVAVVHSETPSGVLNPLREIAAIVRDHGALMVADVVSSLGGEELDFDGWGLDLCVAGPQKCLAGPPGMSLCAISDRCWDAIRDNPSAPRGSFLSLLDWKDRWIDGGRTAFPYTPSVVEVAGVEAACDVVLEMGLGRSIAIHRRAARAVREGVLAMGLELWARDAEFATSCVTSVRVPDGCDCLGTLAHIRERYGVMLSPGYGEIKERLFRLGHQGPGAASLNPVVALAALGRGLVDQEVPVRVGDGVEAALEVLFEDPAEVSS
ncbi:MAG: alanine--glyoxylate aminotransferase family protein [Actinobacteria bacterium]|nr:alanine--glyoxylate aminotransferase family protein [Thermoleophilia bacterium]MCB9011490.1 alanine--glyoxylate aminotransferase family protein [Actinomycetota bacterium]